MVLLKSKPIKDIQTICDHKFGSLYVALAGDDKNVSLQEMQENDYKNRTYDIIDGERVHSPGKFNGDEKFFCKEIGGDLTLEVAEKIYNNINKPEDFEREVISHKNGS